MIPKKSEIEKFTKSKNFKIYQKSMSASFMLMSKVESMLADPEEICSKHGLTIGETKREFNLGKKHFENFNKGFSKMVTNGNKQEYENFWNDYDYLDQLIDKFTGIRNDEREEE